MTIAEVVQEGSGIPKPRLLELQERAREMARYYYDSFTGKLHAMRAGAEIYARTNNECEAAELFACLRNMEDFYAGIPFNDLQTREEFQPLFQVRKLLPELRNSLNNFVNEKTEQRKIEFNQRLHEIGQHGGVYRVTLTKILEEIRKFPEGKDFQLEVRNPTTGEVAYL